MTELLTHTTTIAAAFLSRNDSRPDEVPGLLHGIHAALGALGQPAAPEPEAPLVPAVSIRASVKPDHIVCLDCGAKLKMLKRHLNTHHNLTPEAYRARWGLPADYAIVAPNYAETRRDLAVRIGLGRKAGR